MDSYDLDFEVAFIIFQIAKGLGEDCNKMLDDYIKYRREIG